MRSERGFTLVELMVVIVILGGLVALVGVNVFGAAEEAAVRTAETQLHHFTEAITLYRLQHRRLPRDLAELTPSCLAPDAVDGLSDPRSRQAYRIDYPEPDRATVCAVFEGPAPDRRFGGAGTFDAASGCVSVTLGRG